MRESIDTTASAIGRGLLAGFAGTVAMTIAMRLDNLDQGPEDSGIPAEGAAEVLGIDSFEDDRARARTGELVHWGYGTAVGAVRGLLGRTGMGPNLADTAFHGVVWAAEQALLPALDLAPPTPKWSRAGLTADLVHHAVYGLATNGVYRLLSPST